MSKNPNLSLDSAILLHWPAMELQFFHALSSEKKQFWIRKWVEGGGKLYDGRLIALKNDPVWRVITKQKRLKGEALRYLVFRGVDVTRNDAVLLGLLQSDEMLEIAAFDDEVPSSLTRKFTR